MKRKALLFVSLLYSLLYADFSKTLPYFLSESDRAKGELVWEVVDTEPFDELILSWNALRTTGGDYAFFVSLRQEGIWSPDLYYGDWGVRGQMLTGESPSDSFVKTGRGKALVKKGVSDAFRIRVISAGKEKLSSLHALWVSTAHLSAFKPSEPTFFRFDPVLLEPVPRQSLITLRLPRSWDMTMLAAMLSALQYLGKERIDIEDFANSIMDGDYECYDFWPLHVAEAYHRLKGAYWVHVEHLPHFSDLHAQLKKGRPVLINIQGTPMGGFIWPSYRSHILCVIGYDPETRKVHCLDPIFPGDKGTYITYDLDDLLRLWAKRQNIACVFTEPKG